MSTLTLRPYRGETDLSAIANLINACEAVDQLGGGTSVAELEDQLSYPSFNPERDLRLWEDGDGTLIAIGKLWLPPVQETQDVGLMFKVLPSARNRGLENEIITWAEKVTQHLCREQNLQGRLRVSIRETQTNLVELLKQSGFTVERHFLRMQRSLQTPIPEPQLPQGFEVRSLAGEAELPAWVECFNQSFIDHWDHHELNLDDRRHWNTASNYRADLDLVMTAPDGTFAAVCFNEIEPDHIARIGRKEGSVNILGTRRGFRRLGLGRAILLTALHQLKAGGMDYAYLNVDAQNPNGAKQLYESIEFSPMFARLVFCKVV
jgi:mycothiol synthase